MDKQLRVINIDTLKAICKDKRDITGVIVGHENCPHFYKQSEIDNMIICALDANLNISVNIPVLFEEYLDEFKAEASRLISKYPKVKLVVNDWGLLYYLHKKYPDMKFTAGKGISFTYGDNPWNEHILLAEKEKYREILKAHNMENQDTIKELKRLGINEVELSDLALSKKTYEHLKSEGFIVSVNKGISVVTMSRACHCLRFLDKCSEIGNCIKYCNKTIILSIQQYFDMMNTELKPLSIETKKMQPDMIFNGNITFVKNEQVIEDYKNIDILIIDERIYGIYDES